MPRTEVVEEWMLTEPGSSATAAAARDIALARLGAELPSWGGPRIVWRECTPERKPVFALEDEDEAAYWGYIEGLWKAVDQALKTVMTAIGKEMVDATQELMRRSHAKSEFLRRESDIWAYVPRLRGLLEQTNDHLAQKSAEAGDLLVRCDTLKAEAAEARAQVAPLAEQVRKLEADLAQVTSEQYSSKERARKLEEDLIQVSTERNIHRTEAVNQAATARALGQEVERLKDALQQKEGALADATRLAEA